MTADQPRADAIAAYHDWLRSPVESLDKATIAALARDIDAANESAVTTEEVAAALVMLGWNRAALAPADPTADHPPRLSVDGVCCDAHAATLCACGNFGKHVANVDCTAPADPKMDYKRRDAMLAVAFGAAPADPTADLRAAATDAMRYLDTLNRYGATPAPAARDLAVRLRAALAASTTEDGS